MHTFKYLIQCDSRPEFLAACRRLQIPPQKALWSERPYDVRGLKAAQFVGMSVHTVAGYVPTANCRETRSELTLRGWDAPM